MAIEDGLGRECPSCALPVDGDVDECPYCGYEFPKSKNSVKIVAIVMALLLIWPVVRLLQYLVG